MLSPQQVVTEGIRAKAGSHRWKLCRIKGLEELPVRGPLVTRQQSQWPRLGFAARSDLLIRAPEPSLAKLQMLQFFGAQAKGAEQLEGNRQRGSGMPCTIASMSGTAIGVVTARLSLDRPMIVERSGGGAHRVGSSF